MYDAINSWIENGAGYAAGVALYAQYGRDLFLSLVLKKGETTLNRQKLNEALTALRDKAAPAPASTRPAAGDIPPAPKSAEPITDKTTPPAVPAIMQVTRQRDQTHAEIRILHNSLCEMPEGQQLFKVAKRMVRLGKKNAELWIRYNYLTEGGIEAESFLFTILSA